MQTLIIIWQPNANWNSLGEIEKRDYLKNLNNAVNAARSNGLMTLGWSKIDNSLNKAPAEGFVGVFAVSNSEQIHELEKNISASGWYDYFDSTNVSINPQGGTNPEPGQEYARLLGINLN